MDNVMLGYELQREDGTIEFTRVFEGDRLVLETLKSAFGPLEYHGPKRIVGCRWVIRAAETGAVA